MATSDHWAAGISTIGPPATSTLPFWNAGRRHTPLTWATRYSQQRRGWACPMKLARRCGCAPNFPISAVNDIERTNAMWSPSLPSLHGELDVVVAMPEVPPSHPLRQDDATS